MAIGDDALTAGIQLVPGTGLRSDIDMYINRLADEVARRTAAVMPLTKGGTGATTAVAARAALDVLAAADVVRSGNGLSNVLRLTYTGGRYRMRVDATDVGDIATIQDVQSVNDSLAGAIATKANASDLGGKVNRSGDTMTGDLTVPNAYVSSAFAASSGYVIAYIDGNGRIAKGASSARYKKFIKPQDPTELGDLFPEFDRWQMRAQPGSGTDGEWKYGYIAEVIAAHPDTARFAVYADIDGERVPESIDFIGLLLSQAAQLNVQLTEARAHIDVAYDYIEQLEERIARLEGER